MSQPKSAPHYDDVHWMKIALDLAARAASQDEVPVGAVLVVDNRIVSKSFNKKEQWKTPIGHAEVLCLHRASQKLGRWRLSDATLYVTLEPCVMCSGLLVQSRIGRLVYGAKDPKAGGIESIYQLAQDSKLNHRYPVTAGVLADECGKILTDFFKAKRKLVE
jgi:tRNA(adenine34) deaminase